METIVKKVRANVTSLECFYAKNGNLSRNKYFLKKRAKNRDKQNAFHHYHQTYKIYDLTSISLDENVYQKHLSFDSFIERMLDKTYHQHFTLIIRFGNVPH